MSKVGAIICELNPLHLGHKYLIDTAKAQGITHLIGIMSGDFVQRGEPAILSKETRTEIALLNGFDLILELPSIWAMSVAERFSLAGVSIAENLGCVDNLIFGSECGDLQLLNKISDAMFLDSFGEIMKSYLNKAYTFAQATELSVEEILGTKCSEALRMPNNVLAVEYLKALRILDSAIRPLTVKRIGDYNTKQPTQGICSSSYLRESMKNEDNNWSKFVPDNCRKIILDKINNSFAPATLKACDIAILYKLRTMSEADFLNIPDVNEGLENRILKAAACAESLEALISKISTKRYTKARIRRIIMCAFLGILKSEQELSVPYINVLGSNKKGIEILKLAKKFSKISIISRYSDYKKLNTQGQLIFQKERKINSVYNLMFPKILSSDQSLTKKFILGKD